MKLEHADSEAIAYLSETIIEAKLNEKESSIIKCKICTISKAHQIILWCSSMQSAEKSFEWIH